MYLWRETSDFIEKNHAAWSLILNYLNEHNVLLVPFRSHDALFYRFPSLPNTSIGSGKACCSTGDFFLPPQYSVEWMKPFAMDLKVIYYVHFNWGANFCLFRYAVQFRWPSLRFLSVLIVRPCWKLWFFSSLQLTTAYNELSYLHDTKHAPLLFCYSQAVQWIYQFSSRLPAPCISTFQGWPVGFNLYLNFSLYLHRTFFLAFLLSRSWWETLPWAENCSKQSVRLECWFCFRSPFFVPKIQGIASLANVCTQLEHTAEKGERVWFDFQQHSIFPLSSGFISLKKFNSIK